MNLTYKQLIKLAKDFLGGKRIPDGRGSKHLPGVVFYQVGRNASHSFYLGVDDVGQVWRLTSGERLPTEEEYDANPDGDYGMEEDVDNVTDKENVYLGHF